MYQYPYGNAQQLNLDWLMEQWQTVKQSIDGSLQGEIDRVEAAITDLLAARDAAVAAAGAANTSAGDAAASAQAAAADAATATAQAAAATQERVNAAQAANNAQSYAGNAQTQAAAAQNAAGQAAASASQAAADASDAHDDALAASGSAVNAAASAAGALQNFQLSDAARQAAQAAAALLQPPATVADIGKALIVKTVGGGTVTAYELGESGGGGGTPSFINTIENAPAAAFEDGINAPVKNIVIDVKPFQAGSGTPAPDNVRNINGRTGLTLYETGMNIWDGEFEEGNIRTSNGTPQSSTSYNRTKNFIPVAPNTLYTQGGTPASTYRWFWYREDYSFIQYDVASSRSAISPPDAAYLKSTWTVADMATPENVSFNCSDSNTDYHAYRADATSYQITFPTDAGTVYGGLLTINENGSGELEVTHVKKTLDNIGWIKYTNANGYYVSGTFTNMKSGSWFSDEKTLCNMYPKTNTYGTAKAVRFGNNNTNIYFCNFDTDYPTIEDWQTFIEGANIDVVYPVNSVIYQLTVEQVITILAGTNTIWSDSGSIINLQYVADSKDYIDEHDKLVKALIAPVLDDMIADIALTANDFRIVDNTLYRITTTVAAGAALTPNTNCTATTIGAVLKTLLT